MKTLVTGALKCNKEQIKEMEKMGLDITYIKNETEKVNLDFSNIEFIICNSFFLYNDINLFKNLKAIQLTSAGLDRVPLEYIRNHNIKLFNARGVYSIPMAEWTILKILEIYKDSKKFYKNQKKHLWEKNRELIELNGKIVTILGFGNVAEEIAKRLKGFNVYINAVDIKDISNENVDQSYNILEIDKVLPKSDIVIITLPLNESTKKMINIDRMRKMKNQSILINISRGGVIEEEDLIKMIEEKKFLGVILDVFENEPLDENSKLWDFNNVIVTPHNSFVGSGNEARMIEMIMSNLEKIERNNI